MELYLSDRCSQEEQLLRHQLSSMHVHCDAQGRRIGFGAGIGDQLGVKFVPT